MSLCLTCAICVSRFYDSEHWYEVLKDVSFAVDPGEVVGIVGESGCGKSLTALSVLACCRVTVPG